MTKGREAIYIEPNNMAQIERMRRYYQMIAKQTGRSVRPFRGDGYVNLVTQLGNNRNNQAPVYRPELLPSDTELAALYEGSGLFSKIIDAPAEEAIKHGFELQDVTDAKINDFISEALDELEWENTAATAIKWSRLFGGSIIVMLIDDGRGIDEPLDWKNIKSIDELRVFERAIVVPDETSMYRYVPGNPLGGNRYGEPEFYTVSSRYGFFNVHESRCLVFRNGRVPEFSANSIYQLWGIPEYVRMKQALANSELAYGSAPKMLERCVQAVYKMKNLAEELSTEDGEQNVLKRLEVIDLARGLLNSIAIDNEGEDYDFKTFSFSGVADVIDSTCNMLSAVSNIPQTILFGRSPAGMNATGTSDLENWYNYIERVQKTQVKKNLRYLLSVIFQAGMYHGEIDEIPKIKISFNPLWSLSEQDKANVDKVKADTELVRANTANLYIQADVISSDEVRSALAKTDEFDIETMLDDMEDDENLMTSIHDPVNEPDGGDEEENSGADVTDNTDPTAPDATKNPAESAKANLPTEPKRSDGNDYDDFPEYGMWLEEHMEATREEQKAAEEHYKALKKAGNRQHSNRDNQSTKEQKTGGVGVIVVKDGKILCGKRHNDTGYGLLCGPGGHVEHGETAEQAAIRETQEEFGITPKNIIQLGYGPKEPETGIAPAIFLCTEYDGEPECDDLEMVAPQFMSLDELEAKSAEQYQPFKDGIVVLMNCLNMNHDGDSAFFGGELNSVKPGSYDVMRPDGGAGSGNFGHAGVPGQVGGSAPAGAASSAASAEKVSTLKENFGNLKQNQKYAYLGRTGIVPKGELDSLKAGVASSDQKAIAKLAEYEETYFNLAEYGSEAKSLKVEMRDDVAAMSDDDAAAWAKQSMDRRLESHEGWANQYSAAQKVAIDMGVYETPQVVSQDDFDKYVKESGAAVCYRGVKDIDSMTGENMMFQMAYNTQEPYYGDGIFGDGLYFSTRKETAEGYAGRAAIATCAVRPDSKILEYGSPEHEKAKKRVQTTDDSVAALCSGYDVIHKKMGGNEDYYVILNRAALVMVDPVSKQGDLAIRAAQKNAGRSNGDSTRISPENNMGNLDNCGKNATIKVQKTHTDGGPSSGNFGHAGRTGKVGGSASGESAIEVKGSSGKKAKISIPTIDTGDAAAEVKNGRHNSLEKYIDSDGNLSPERQALHAEIVSGYFEGKEKVDGVRTATFLGGGPASGKSSLRDSGLIVQADDPSTVTIDPDGLKGKLPGYEEMASETDSAAAFYHEESSAVAKTLYSTALDYGCNTVYDGTGDGSVNSMRKKIKDAHDAGYKAVGEYVTVDIDEALRRNELRYEAAKEKYEKGLSKVPPRLPDAQIVKSIHRKVTDISVECASEFDSIKIYDNNGARGSAPTLIATGGNGKPLSAVNKTLLQKYLDKGEKKWKIDEKGEVVPG